MTIISLKESGLNAPIKRHTVKMNNKTESIIMMTAKKTYLNSQINHRLKVKDWRTILQANNYSKKALVATFNKR